MIAIGSYTLLKGVKEFPPSSAYFLADLDSIDIVSPLDNIDIWYLHSG